MSWEQEKQLLFFWLLSYLSWQNIFVLAWRVWSLRRGCVANKKGNLACLVFELSALAKTFVSGAGYNYWTVWNLFMKLHRWVGFYLFGPHFDLYQSLNQLPIWNSQNCSIFPLAFVARWLQGHWWGFISRNYVVWPTFLLMNVFTALKKSHFWFLFDFTAAGVVPCGGRKTSPRTSTIVQFIFYFGPLRSAIIFWEIRNKWLV